MSQPFNTESKKIIRSDWAKPILKFLHAKAGKKLIYVGLPSQEALDIVTWIEHLDKIYAFMCRDYGTPSSPTQSRDGILRLDQLLRDFERKKLLSSYEVYDGYLEETVIRGFDNSPTRRTLAINDIITVYNLDYCNGLASPLKYVDANGDHQTAFKFTAIKKLLDIQADLPSKSPNKKFVLFLTIHCSYQQHNPGEFNTLPEEFQPYIASVNKLSKDHHKAPYLVKAHAFHNLRNFLLVNNFLPEFLPVIHYTGDGNHPLLVLTVIGTQIKAAASLPQPLQHTEAFLSGPFISIDKSGKFVNNDQLKQYPGVAWQNPDPLELFKESQTFTKYWKT